MNRKRTDEERRRQERLQRMAPSSARSLKRINEKNLPRSNPRNSESGCPQSKAAERKRIAEADAEEQRRIDTGNDGMHEADAELVCTNKREHEAVTHAIRAAETHKDALTHINKSDMAAENAKKLM
ncbi:hypothetical protein FRB97_005533 [Tulasnella sp. 331]|nr:hypothetical protein FRB97_005533 [Tulasnella sp. 331]